jgi:large subunit ribosomal protein L9
MASAIELILTEDVDKLGRTGQLVKVKPGYARNFLLPKKLAVLADTENLELYEQKRAELEEEARRRKESAEEAKLLLDESDLLLIRARSGESGKLFGSITKDEICRAIKDQLKVQVDKDKIKIKNPIKSLGEFTVQIGLGTSVDSEIRLKVEKL